MSLLRKKNILIWRFETNINTRAKAKHTHKRSKYGINYRSSNKATTHFIVSCPDTRESIYCESDSNGKYTKSNQGNTRHQGATKDDKENEFTVTEHFCTTKQ